MSKGEERKERMERKEVVDYSNYPGTMAPRRFELINTAFADDAVYGHGVEMYSGVCFVERPGASAVDRMVGFATIADVEKYLHIRWIDPPFERGKEEEE